jgi:hypothetical protein
MVAPQQRVALTRAHPRTPRRSQVHPALTTAPWVTDERSPAPEQRHTLTPRITPLKSLFSSSKHFVRRPSTKVAVGAAAVAAVAVTGVVGAVSASQAPAASAISHSGADIRAAAHAAAGSAHASTPAKPGQPAKHAAPAHKTRTAADQHAAKAQHKAPAKHQAPA